MRRSILTLFMALILIALVLTGCGGTANGKQVSYTVEYYYDGILDSSKTEALTGVVDQTITTVTDKAGDYVVDPAHNNLPFVLTASPSDNVIQIYYIAATTDPGAGPFTTLDGAQTLMKIYYSISGYCANSPSSLVDYLKLAATWDSEDMKIIKNYEFINSGVAYQDFKTAMLQWVSEAEFIRLSATTYDNVAVYQNVDGMLYVFFGSGGGNSYTVWNIAKLNSDPNRAEFNAQYVCGESATGMLGIGRFVLIKQSGYYVVDEYKDLGSDPSKPDQTFYFEPVSDYRIDYDKNTITGFAGETIQDFSDTISSWFDYGTLTVKWFNNGAKVTSGVINSGMVVQIEFIYNGVRIYAEYTVV